METSAHKQSLAASRMRPALLVAFGAALCIATTPALSQRGPRDAGPRREMQRSVDDRLLRRFIEAGRGVNLRGKQIVLTITPQGTACTTTNRVLRTRDGYSLAVCLEPAAQRGAVTTDDGKWRRRYDPRQRLIRSTRSIPRVRDERSLMRTVRLIRRNYVVTLLGRESFAGRPCNVLEFVPRDPCSHTLKVWIDTETGLVLCRQESDSRGNTLGLVMFTSVEYPKKIPDSEVRYRFPRGTRSVNLSRSPIMKDVGRLRRQAKFEIYQPVWMPGGYEFEHCELVAPSGAPTACLRYTDGIATITVCQTHAAEPRPPHFRRGGWVMLPLGEAMAALSWGQMDFMVLGHRDAAGLEPILRALDNDRERECLLRLERAYHVTPATLAAMRSQGLSIDAMGALLEIAAQTGRPLATLLARYQEGWGCHRLARLLKVNWNNSRMAQWSFVGR